MCLIAIAYRIHPEYPLVLAANRDEYFRRPTAPADFWPEAPQVLAGRDLEQGGTWMGITRSGRFAAITNFREKIPKRSGARSRGLLVKDYLEGGIPPLDFLRALSPHGREYNGFNFIVGDAGGLYYFSNRGNGIVEIPPGVHGISNHLLNTPWSKVERVKRRTQSLLDRSGEELIGALLEMLEDRAPALDSELSDTGLDPGWERTLSAPFIATPEYGTRLSTVILADRRGEVNFVERSFAPGGKGAATVTHRFRLDR